jgi:cellulose synthase/poly-beta-1,6-N-acetylglucosamine synthase-like glycosyltransferase
MTTGLHAVNTVTEVPGVGPVENVPKHYKPIPPELRADRLLTIGQAVTLALMVLTAAGLVTAQLVWHRGPSLLTQAGVVLDVVTVLNFVIIAYKVSLFGRSLGYKPEPVDVEALAQTPKGGWPTCNILLPGFLMHERDPDALIVSMLHYMDALDYPRERLRVLIAVEFNDDKAREALSRVKLPPSFHIVVCVKRPAKGKPGACNYAVLTHGYDEGLTVIYDLEDRPDRWQQRQAAHDFALLPPSVVCLQAQLQFYEPDRPNWITKIFTAEYSSWFGTFLPGLTRAGAAIPLGGTSNIFRTRAALVLGLWDPYNKTEDMDLGTRIARRGWKTRMLNSVTFEEPNSQVGNWMVQRSRWIKGAIQTWLVHMRNPWRLWRDLGTARFCSWQLTVGFATFTIMVNPALWALSGLYFLSKARGWDGVTSDIQSLFPGPIYYLGMLGLAGGNLAVVYFLLVGAMSRGLHKSVSALMMLPVYWMMMFAAGIKACYELSIPSKRDSWAHTKHGLRKAAGETLPAVAAVTEGSPTHQPLPAVVGLTPQMQLESE